MKSTLLLWMKLFSQNKVAFTIETVNYGGVLVPPVKDRKKFYVGLIKSYVGDNISYVGLSISYVGLSIPYVGDNKSYVGLTKSY